MDAADPRKPWYEFLDPRDWAFANMVRWKTTNILRQRGCHRALGRTVDGSCRATGQSFWSEEAINMSAVLPTVCIW